MRNYIKEFMDDNGIAEDEHFLIEGEKPEFHYHKGGRSVNGNKI
ncbi:MAG: hypothetical protein ACI4DP_00095 [Candidatus Ornithomonoglobus sp.]